MKTTIEQIIKSELDLKKVEELYNEDQITLEELERRVFLILERHVDLESKLGDIL